LCAAAALLFAGAALAQVITINTATGAVTNDSTVHSTVIDRRYTQIQPTHVELSKTRLDERARLLLIRQLVAEQGFAMRPFPLGHQGLTLAANGNLAPAGEAYQQMTIAEGTAAKPGDRLVMTDVKIEPTKIVFILNGGPDIKHRFLRNIEIGGGVADAPIVRDDGKAPVGSRLTLTFGGPIPELSGADVKALLAPLISFSVETPVVAFTDTLPQPLKEAILNHHVMVGMTTDMVLFAKGRPQTKTREMDGQIPFEEWIYGKPPEEVDFVRINGNQVIRVEIAKMGEPLAVFTKDEVSRLLLTDGTPAVPVGAKTHPVEIGDVQRDPDKEAPSAPPTLRKPGETLPSDPTLRQTAGQKGVGVSGPVQFPKEKPEEMPGANPDGAPDGTGQAPASASPAAGGTAPVAGATQPAPATPQTPAASQPN
jgi:hypothetical protein